MIQYDLPMEEYLKHPALNSSKLKLMLKTALDYKVGLEEVSENTKSTLLGTAVHTLLLEPKTFDGRYALQGEDFGDKRSGDGKKRWDAFKKDNAHKTVLGREESVFLQKLQEKVRQNTSLRLLIASGQSEVTGFFEDETGLKLKARGDLLAKDTIWDVKTTTDGIDDFSLYRTIKKYRYDFQAAHYLWVFNHLLGAYRKFGWIFVDTSSPAQHIRLIKAPEIMIRKALYDHGSVLDSIRDCMKDDIWEGYSQHPVDLEMPYWAEELK
jgi:exodeoxyribonuclease VIII